MQTIDTIKERRSIRGFKKDDVYDEMITDIINCGRLAPSAKNRQPWYFIITKNNVKNKISHIMKKYTEENDVNKDAQILKCPSSVLATSNVIKQAPVLILIFKEKDNNWIIGDNLSIGACVENMCLRAVELGLGTLWIRDTVYVSNEIAKMVGHDDMELNCALAIGYPNQNPNPRPRKKLEDIIEWKVD